jgi:polyisoprenoid-binding protein YceI
MLKILKVLPAVLIVATTSTVYAKTEKFVLDSNHTNIIWHANHLGFSNPDGKFAKANGYITLDEKNPSVSSVNVTIDTSSIITGNEAFDKHLKGSDFFNVEKYKTATFVSTKVDIYNEKYAKIYGDFTMLGVTKPVVLYAKLNKIGKHPFTKKKSVGFSATTVIKRSEFGMNYGIGMVSDDIQIAIEVEAAVE